MLIVANPHGIILAHATARACALPTCLRACLPHCWARIPTVCSHQCWRRLRCQCHSLRLTLPWSTWHSPCPCWMVCSRRVRGQLQSAAAWRLVWLRPSCAWSRSLQQVWMSRLGMTYRTLLPAPECAHTCGRTLGSPSHTTGCKQTASAQHGRGVKRPCVAFWWHWFGWKPAGSAAGAGEHACALLACVCMLHVLPMCVGACGWHLGCAASEAMTAISSLIKATGAVTCTHAALWASNPAWHRGVSRE